MYLPLPFTCLCGIGVGRHRGAFTHPKDEPHFCPLQIVAEPLLQLGESEIVVLSHAARYLVHIRTILIVTEEFYEAADCYKNDINFFSYRWPFNDSSSFP